MIIEKNCLQFYGRLLKSLLLRYYENAGINISEAVKMRSGATVMI